VLVPLLVALAAAAVLVLALVGSGDGGEGESAEESTSVDRSEVVDRGGEAGAREEADPALVLGDPDAPVTMVEYSDFQCPFCGRFARETAPELVDKYVDRGVLRIEWRDFPYLGPESMVAAEAGRAAAAQDRFWEFHDEMYADQPPPNSGRIDRAYLVDVAERAGLDVDRFEADLDDPAHREAIQQDFRAGQSVGVTGTPAFIINGQLVMGAQPLPVFEDVIQRAADAAGE
jgi:protein-disulfide isomerase